MSNCVMCGLPLPDNQGSRSCSMCYGDIDHGTDGYYRDWLERQDREEQEHEQEQKQEHEQDTQ